MFTDGLLPIGALPKWILTTAALSLNSTIICYASTSTGLVRRTYSRAASSDLTRLSSRTFGTWNLLSTIVRVYAAYHINDQTAYTLALWTYVVALAHFGIEWLVFGTAGGVGMLAVEALPFGTVIAMLWQWDGYVQ